MKKPHPLVAPGELIDVGGYRLHLLCTGAGEPTVVLEADTGGFSSSWSLVQAEVARFTRVCSYDRAGYAWSDRAPGSMPRTSDQLARELHVLLHRAGVRPPLVLVGHSYGGYHVRLYASRFPEEVAGMVLVDAAHDADQGAQPRHAELQGLRLSARRLAGFQLLARVGLLRLLLRVRPPESLRQLPPHAQEAVRRLGFRPKTIQAVRRELRSLGESMRQVREQAGSLGDRPLVVIRRPRSEPHAVAQAHEWEVQIELATLSTRSRVMTAAPSGPGLPIDQAALVVEAIRDVVERVRAAAGSAPEER